MVVRAITRRHLARHADQATRWRVLSAASLIRPMTLPVVMTSAPRWNTHAIVANVGPLRVTRSLAIHRSVADTSAASWTIVAYAYPGHRTVARLGSADGRGDDAWQDLPLDPGRYSLILRYYHWRDDVRMPAVKIDGEEIVGEIAVPTDVNAFYADLWKRRRLLYRLLHSYVFTLVRLRKWLPASFVRGELLPVGNPDTEFYYDVVWPGARCRVSADPEVLLRHDVFYTLYGRDSFPLAWEHITEAEHTTAAAREKGVVLLRVQGKRGEQPAFDRDRVRIRVG
jgi:hypothetical protein